MQLNIQYPNAGLLGILGSAISIGKTIRAGFGLLIYTALRDQVL